MARSPHRQFVVLRHQMSSSTEETVTPSLVLRESLSEHRSATFRLPFCGLVLNYVPMFDKDSVLNAQNICGNPIHRSTEPAKSPVDDHEVSLGQDRSRLVLQSCREALNKIEKTLAARRDVSAMLNVIRRPEPFRYRVVALVEQRVAC